MANVSLDTADVVRDVSKTGAYWGALEQTDCRVECGRFESAWTLAYRSSDGRDAHSRWAVCAVTADTP